MRARSASLIFFAAFLLPAGVVVHLGAEYAALGPTLFAPALLLRHAYLVILAVSALSFGVMHSGPGQPWAVRRALLRNHMQNLPLGGRGLPFGLLCFLFFAGFFTITQLGEGCILSQGDVGIGVVTAIIASVLGACFSACLPEQVLIFVSCMHVLRDERLGCRRPLPAFCGTTHAQSRLISRYYAVLGNRPPPLLTTV